MAAVGLMPDLRILDDDETTAGIHLSTLVEFVFAMRDRLLNINENSYNNFMLRVGTYFMRIQTLTAPLAWSDTEAVTLINTCCEKFQ